MLNFFDRLENNLKEFFQPTSETATAKEKVVGYGKAIIAAGLTVVVPSLMLFLMPVSTAAVIMGGALAAGGGVIFAASKMTSPDQGAIAAGAGVPAGAADNSTPALQVKLPSIDFNHAVENKGADAGVKNAAPAPVKGCHDLPSL